MSVMMVKTKCKLNNTELFLKLFHIQCKEIGNNKYYQGFQLFCKVADILLKAPDVNVFLAP